ncbi:small Trp-rich protein [Lactococcus cremoris]|nr:small Trp-rich protein [Lactococcus cremoris]
MSNKSSNSGGVGFFGLLQIVFIVLKLINAINWSWFWVLSPAIFGIAILLILFLILCYLKYQELK